MASDKDLGLLIVQKTGRPETAGLFWKGQQIPMVQRVELRSDGSTRVVFTEPNSNAGKTLSGEYGKVSLADPEWVAKQRHERDAIIKEMREAGFLVEVR